MMLRDINTEVLIDLNITAHQFILAILLMSKQYDHLEKYIKESNSYDTFPYDLERLALKSLVAYHNDKPYNFKSIVVQPEFHQVLYKDDIFQELLNTYPAKVTRPDGVVSFLPRGFGLLLYQ